jgi:ferric-dicitrate binding protein FerR (iron transport regulator)
VKQDFNSKLDLLLTEERIAYRDSNEVAKQKVLQRIQVETKVIAIDSGKRTYRALAAAAAIAIVAVLSVSFLGDQTITTGQTPLVVSLPDGSEVKLDQKSTLSYNSITWSLARRLDLSGAAFFEVEEGSKFTVHTAKGNVSVLGTSFSVIDGNKSLNVACKTGKVLVSNGNGLSSILTPGKAVEMSENSIEEMKRSPQYIGGWLESTYRFDDIAVSEVFTALEDVSRYNFDISANSSMKYSGEFSTSQSLKEILDIVCKPLGLDYTIYEDDKIVQITNK